MKIAVLAVQGAFAEHAKRVQELGAEPADHQSFLHATFLFTDARTGVSITERALANWTTMGVLTALNKKHQYPP